MNTARSRQHGLPFGISETSLVLVVLLVLSLTSVASAEEPATDRLSLTSKGGGDARDSRNFDAVTTDSHKALLEKAPPKSLSSTTAGKTTEPGTQQESAYGDYWVYSVDVELFNDNDRDGYYHGVDVLFDVDTIYDTTDIYAVAYLSFEGGPWNEYAVSEDFTLFGTTSTDDYVLVTELLQGYPAGSYDLLIEIYESATGLYVASAGPDESLQFKNLPLEDADRDLPLSPAPAIARTIGGGGANSLPFLIALLGVLLLARQQGRKE